MIKNQAITQLEQVRNLLRPISQDQFTEPLPILSGNTIGKHVRHILEFFICLDAGLETGKVNYDQRQRDLDLETLPDFAIDSINKLIARVSSYQNIDIILDAEFDKVVASVQSNVSRELVYNIEHCIHHLAIIRIGIELYYPDIILEEGLGVAYSTQRHNKEVVCAQ
jgi:hypothetical protein